MLICLTVGFDLGSGLGPPAAPAPAPTAAYPASLTVMQLQHGTQSIYGF